MTDEQGEVDGSGAYYEEDDEPVTEADLLDPGGGPVEELSEYEQILEAEAEEFDL